MFEHSYNLYFDIVKYQNDEKYSHSFATSEHIIWNWILEMRIQNPDESIRWKFNKAIVAGKKVCWVGWQNENS